jgi:outer membrane PBP1 activator LpoA protein
MKRKEREHLKEDPFQLFIAKSLEILNKFKKQIFIGLAAAAAVIVIVLAISFFNSLAASAENRLFADAVSIKSDEKLNVDQKIEKLSQFKTKSGISSSIKLFLAALYFEKGDVTKAKEILDSFSSSHIKLLNDQKKLLEADILVASNKISQALDLLNQLLADPKSEITNDYVLIKMARIQAKNEQTATAIANLNKIIAEYPQSIYSYEAKNFLTELEKK